MKLRQVDDREPKPVDKRDLKPGDHVENGSRPYLIRPEGSVYYACNMNTGYDTTLSDPIYRIRITGKKGGKLAWERIGNWPKPVTWEELKHGDYLADTGAGAVDLFQLVTHYGVRWGVRATTGIVYGIGAFAGDILYRAEFCGFEEGTNGEEGTHLWRRI